MHIDAEKEWFIRIDGGAEDEPATVAFAMLKPPGMFHCFMLRLLFGWRVRHVTDLPPPLPPMIDQTFSRDEEYERSTVFPNNIEVLDD
jgi:hypothetical protein